MKRYITIPTLLTIATLLSGCFSHYICSHRDQEQCAQCTTKYVPLPTSEEIQYLPEDMVLTIAPHPYTSELHRVTVTLQTATAQDPVAYTFWVTNEPITITSNTSDPCCISELPKDMVIHLDLKRLRRHDFQFQVGVTLHNAGQQATKTVVLPLRHSLQLVQASE